MTKIWRSALVALFFVSAFASLADASEIFAREPLTIVTADRQEHLLNVELALTEAQREQGLMFRRMMGENEGMLFDFGDSRLVTMWMKNTLLSLDMLFMDGKGKVTHVHENAVPLSETIISSGGPVRFVLELSAGTVKRLHIGEGDVVRSRQIGNDP